VREYFPLAGIIIKKPYRQKVINIQYSWERVFRAGGEQLDIH